MANYQVSLTMGIKRTPEFERKGLAEFAVNVGTKCGHDCTYCSTGAVLRTHWSFQQVGESPFARGYSIVDPDTPEGVAHDAESMRTRGLVQLCTYSDAWSPEAQQHNLGRRCLQAILSQPGWTVRILTKNADVVNDFDLIQQYRDRVLVGVSLTGTPPQEEALLGVIEPNASLIGERFEVYREAKRCGLRTYGMLCPVMPWLSFGQIDRLVGFVLDHGAEEVFVESINGRGSGLRLTEEALRNSGFRDEANWLEIVRHREGWSTYTRQLLEDVQDSMRQRNSLDKLRFLLYPSRLTKADREWIEFNDDGVKWLGKD